VIAGLALVALKTLHLLAVNVGGAGPLVCVPAEWLGQRNRNPACGQAARRLAVVSCWAIVGGVGLGLALALSLWFVGDPWLTIVRRLAPSRLWFAAMELVFSLVCLAIYLRWFDRWPRTRRWQRIVHRMIALAAASNMLYHFPPLMVIIGELAAGSDSAPAVIDSAAVRGLMIRPTVLSLTIHHELAAISAAGAAMLLVARNRLAGRIGAAFALVATIAQIPVGIWTVWELPQAGIIMGEDGIATTLFVVAMVASVFLLQLLATAALGDIESNAKSRAVILMILTVACMIGVLERTRAATHRSVPANAISRALP
jgi:hypothetical protein